jgi:hypothetical protein
MSGWAAMSVAVIMLIMVVITKLDIAFFESNGMIKNDGLREAFFMQVFQVDPIIMLMVLLGFGGVGFLSYLFSRSQDGYFGRLAKALDDFSRSFNLPDTHALGPFNPHITSFFHVLESRDAHPDSESHGRLIDQVLMIWPKKPRLSLLDHGQFAAIAIVLSIFFSAVCMVFYWNVSNKVVALSNQLVRFSTPAGPTFLTEQFQLLSVLVWAVLVQTSLLFMITGYVMSVRIARVNFAVLRDLRVFMEGNYARRVFLRTGDPGGDAVDKINTALERIEGRLRGKGHTMRVAKNGTHEEAIG